MRKEKVNVRKESEKVNFIEASTSPTLNKQTNVRDVWAAINPKANISIARFSEDSVSITKRF